MDNFGPIFRFLFAIFYVFAIFLGIQVNKRYKIPKFVVIIANILWSISILIAVYAICSGLFDLYKIYGSKIFIVTAGIFSIFVVSYLFATGGRK